MGHLGDEAGLLGRLSLLGGGSKLIWERQSIPVWKDSCVSGPCVSNSGTFFTESFPDILPVTPVFVLQSCAHALYLKYLPQK